MKVKDSGRHRNRRWSQLAIRSGIALGAVGSLLVSNCVYDPNRRCDAGQTFDGSACVCGASAVMLDDGQCLPCGANEVATGNACQCTDGFARSSSDAPCELIPSYEPPICDTTSTTPCVDAVISYCHVDAGTSGYCTTSNCSSSEECSNGFRCDTNAQPSYCRRPPKGQGMTCKITADCAGTEATYCDSFQTHQCYVQGCSMTLQSCFPGYACCDLTSLGLANTLCLPEGSCPT